MKPLVASDGDRIVIVHGDEPGMEEAIARLQADADREGDAPFGALRPG